MANKPRKGRPATHGKHVWSHKKEAELWVRQHLSSKYYVHPSKISMEDSLKDWGFDDESSLAGLTGDFNLETRKQRLWQDADVAPPKLIGEVKGKSVGDLVDFLASETESAAYERNLSTTISTIQEWLIYNLQAKYPRIDIGPGSKLGAYPDIPFNANDAWDLERKFAMQFGPCGDIMVGAAGHTISEIAASLFEYLQTKGQTQ